MDEVRKSPQWSSAILSELALFIDYRGRTPKKTASGVRLITAKNIRDGFIKSEPEEYIASEDYDEWMTRGIPRYGDVVITTEAPLGNVAQLKFKNKFALAQRAICLQFFEQDSSKFFHYALRTPEFKKQLTTNATGTTVSGIKSATLKKLPLLIPPLAEQKFIAEKLDKLLAKVDSIKARLDAVPDTLKRFRQSVLAAAVNGKLTEEWRKDNQPSVTQEEFQDEIKKYRYEKWLDEQEAKFLAKGKRPKTESWKKKYVEVEISSDFEKRSLPNGWLYQPLDGLVYIAARIGWKGLKASEYTKEGPLFLSVHSLNYGREVKLSEAFHISQERYDESPEIMLTNDDILLCKDGAGIGKIGIVKGLYEPASINSSLLLIRSGKYFIPEFLYFFLAGPTMQQLVQERMTGSAVPHLFQRDVKEFVLEVPPTEEQIEIVRRVEKLFAYADKVESDVKAAQERVNKLTQSILAKAFRGELTAKWREQNPELISGDNSAEALLAKIKAEREKLKPNKKTRTRKKA